MWGDGKQTRSFTYIDDCVEGVLRITKSDCREPLNLGSSEMVCLPICCCNLSQRCMSGLQCEAGASCCLSSLAMHSLLRP